MSEHNHRPDIGNSGARARVQLFSLVLFNSYFLAPLGKYLCVPVLNCYSCPLGTVACPIGSIISFGLVRGIPYYIIGSLGVAAVAGGRAFCGWACPFGYLQDWLHRLRTPKWRLPRAANGLKYGLLVVLVIALPLALGGGKAQTASERIASGSSRAVDYCGIVCPAGTLEAGVPLLVSSRQARTDMSLRTWSKLAILIAVLGLMIVSRRGFCRALCPLGALMALGAGASLLRLRTDPVKCTKCMRCAKVCPTASRSVPDTPGGREASAECVLCLDCVRSCPAGDALGATFGSRPILTSQGADCAR
ncbi:MAG TPA: 4Fe-4S binding protein [Armatimonadota bacterium]|nr:4Fe-4S binding protein [Armatimonadota bacterium]